MNNKKVLKIINEKLIKTYGEPKFKGTKQTLDVLIGTILSQNTNDKNSYNAFVNLKNRYKSWDKLLESDLSVVENLIKCAGLYKSKAKSIFCLLEYLKITYGQCNLTELLKNDDVLVFSELEKINGIGKKTISCLLLFGCGKNYCPVDTHVYRIFSRIGIFGEKNTKEKIFNSLTMELKNGLEIGYSIHNNLLKLGRQYCLPAKPNCLSCPIINDCGFKKKNLFCDKNEPKKLNNFLLLESI